MKKNVKAFVYTAVSFFIFVLLLCLVKSISAAASQNAKTDFESAVIIPEQHASLSENEKGSGIEEKNKKIINEVNVTWEKGDVEIYQSTSNGDIECYLGSSSVNCAEAYVSQNSKGVKIKDVKTSEKIKIVIPKNIYINTLNIYGKEGDVYVHGIRVNCLNAETSGGDVRLSGVTTDESVIVTTQNGSVTEKGCNSVFFSVRSNKGDISSEGYSMEYYLNTKTGNINFTPVLAGERSDLISEKGDIYARFAEKESFCAYLDCSDDSLTVDRRLMYSISNSCYIYNDGGNTIINVHCEKGSVELCIR